MWVHWASSLDLFVDLDRGHGVREGIETALRQAIRDGRLRLGTALPSTRALARDLAVARGTVSAAYEQLTAEGYLSARQGALSRVCWVPPSPTEPPAAPQGRRAGAASDETDRWDLRPGRANPASFPRQSWSRAIRRVLQRAPDVAFGYGDGRGAPQLREALTAYLGRARAVHVEPDELMVCAGFTQALALVCQALQRAGARTVAMEDPNAPRYRDIARECGLRVVAVPCDEDGLRVADLERHSADAVVVTPAHQYPLGVTLSTTRRQALVSWARRRGALLVEDDYDGEFRFDRRPVGALQQMDPDVVSYVGTASKTLAPGVRLGWLTMPARLRDALVAARELSDRGNPVLDQLALAELIDSGDFDRHVRRMRTVYRRRRDHLLDALAREHPRLRVTGVAAGMHAIVALPTAAIEQRVPAAAGGRGLLVHTLEGYRHDPAASGPAGVIVGYGTPPGHAFRAACEALVRVLGEVGY